MTPIAKAWAWIPTGVRACLAEIHNADVAPGIAAAKLLGELLLIYRAVGSSRCGNPNCMTPELASLHRIATRNAATDEFALWQIRWLCGSSEAPPAESQAYFVWEAKYFLEASGFKSYAASFWQQAAAQALQGALSNDGCIRRHLYNFTHAVFFGADFGIRKGFALTNAVEAVLPALPEMLANSREWDLYYEIQAARAMTDLLPSSWLRDVARMPSLPGQVEQGWVAPSPTESAELIKHRPFEAIYSAVHSTLTALLALGIAQQKTRAW